MSHKTQGVVEAPEKSTEEQPERNVFKINLTDAGEKGIEADCEIDGTGGKLIEMLASLFMHDENYFKIAREAVQLVEKEKTKEKLGTVLEKLAKVFQNEEEG